MTKRTICALLSHSVPMSAIQRRMATATQEMIRTSFNALAVIPSPCERRSSASVSAKPTAYLENNPDQNQCIKTRTNVSKPEQMYQNQDECIKTRTNVSKPGQMYQYWEDNIHSNGNSVGKGKNHSNCSTKLGSK